MVAVLLLGPAVHDPFPLKRLAGLRHAALQRIGGHLGLMLAGDLLRDVFEYGPEYLSAVAAAHLKFVQRAQPLVEAREQPRVAGRRPLLRCLGWVEEKGRTANTVPLHAHVRQPVHPQVIEVSPHRRLPDAQRFGQHGHGGASARLQQVQHLLFRAFHHDFRIAELEALVKIYGLTMNYCINTLLRIALTGAGEPPLEASQGASRSSAVRLTGSRARIAG